MADSAFCPPHMYARRSGLTRQTVAQGRLVRLRHIHPDKRFATRSVPVEGDLPRTDRAAVVMINDRGFLYQMRLAAATARALPVPTSHCQACVSLPAAAISAAMGAARASSRW